MVPENKQLKILINAQLAKEFKAVCKKTGVSMAKELSGYMEGRIGSKTVPQTLPVRIVTRKDRRSAMLSIVLKLVAIREAEQAYMEAIPENLQGGPAYGDAECAIGTMDEAIDLLSEAYG